ncbi:putative membrane protein [Bacillus phage vB_BceM_Bc431v3]|uniref:Putative membrane protein n=1 Tax=Bacillus phage vB_BceM_Bc431v3 TaxID=1195072 RepID=M4HNH6_9CAUD|nr:hemolysin [Bacillus phage vB_BceM_Bc431v3]AFQ96311.1 putative membrane protein [Bacillus phage vB_BceM_Bc431v3]
MNNQQVLLKLQEIESTLQDQEQSTVELKTVVDELRGIVKDIDKNMAISEEKQSHLFYRIEHLEQELEELEEKGEKGTDRQQKLIENALMVILGGLISYIFSLASKH